MQPRVERCSIALQAALEPCDVLLVEGNSRLSAIIKYLTQSTWSHAALYVGSVARRGVEGKSETIIEKYRNYLDDYYKSLATKSGTPEKPQ